MSHLPGRSKSKPYEYQPAASFKSNNDKLLWVVATTFHRPKSNRIQLFAARWVRIRVACPAAGSSPMTSCSFGLATGHMFATRLTVKDDQLKRTEGCEHRRLEQAHRPSLTRYRRQDYVFRNVGKQPRASPLVWFRCKQSPYCAPRLVTTSSR